MWDLRLRVEPQGMMGTIRRSEEEFNLMLEVPAGPERLAADCWRRLARVGPVGPSSGGGLEPRQENLRPGNHRLLEPCQLPYLTA